MFGMETDTLYVRSIANRESFPLILKGFRGAVSGMRGREQYKGPIQKHTS